MTNKIFHFINLNRLDLVSYFKNDSYHNTIGYAKIIRCSYLFSQGKIMSMVKIVKYKYIDGYFPFSKKPHVEESSVDSLFTERYWIYNGYRYYSFEEYSLARLV